MAEKRLIYRYFSPNKKWNLSLLVVGSRVTSIYKFFVNQKFNKTFAVLWLKRLTRTDDLKNPADDVLCVFFVWCKEKYPTTKLLYYQSFTPFGVVLTGLAADDETVAILALMVSLKSPCPFNDVQNDEVTRTNWCSTVFKLFSSLLMSRSLRRISSSCK